MTRLNQILAIEKGARADAERARIEAVREFARTAQLSGITRTYQPRDEDGDQLPPESTNVQVKAEDALRAATAAYARQIDMQLTKDEANMLARADVVVAGTVLVRNAPATWLLQMEKTVAEIRALAVQLPVLDPAEDWTFDENSAVYRTEPVKTVRSRKIPRNHVIAEATKEHPAQVQVYMEDVPAGDWTTVKFSGAVPALYVRQLVARLDALLRALKYAREEANSREITDHPAGARIMGFLLGDAIAGVQSDPKSAG
jgi:hypothetical protein